MGYSKDDTGAVVKLTELPHSRGWRIQYSRRISADGGAAVHAGSSVPNFRIKEPDRRGGHYSGTCNRIFAFVHEDINTPVSATVELWMRSYQAYQAYQTSKQ